MAGSDKSYKIVQLQTENVKRLKAVNITPEGNIVEIKHKTVRVQLPSLGYTLTATIEKSNVEILSLYGEISSSNVI